MDPAVKLNTAQALFPLLSVFHEIDGLPLKGVSQVWAHDCIGAICLDFGSRFLAIRAQEEDDTIDLSLGQGLPEGVDSSDRKPWVNLIGKPFGWAWVMVNQQGYLDGMLFSFGEVSPQFAVTVTGSCLHVSNLNSL